MKSEFRKTSLFIVVSFLSILYFNTNAQTIQSSKDVVYINYLTTGKAGFKDQNGSLSQSIIDFSVNTPSISISKKLQINNLVDARMFFNASEDVGNSLLPLPDRLYEFRYTLFARHTISKTWKMIYIPRLHIRSDLAGDKLDNEFFFPQLIVIALKNSKKIPNLSWGFGINYNNNQGKNSVLPVVSLLYSNAKMKINARLPQSADITFIHNKKMEYGLALNLEGSIAYLKSDGITKNTNYLKRQNIYVYPHISTNITSNVWLNLKAGLLINNNYSFVNEDYEIANNVFENSLKTSLFMQLGLSYRLHK